MSRGSRQSAPAAVRWTAYVGVAIVFAIACAFLSHWQWSKNVARSTELATISRNYDADPVPLAQLLPTGTTLASRDQWHPVSMTGTYLRDHQLLVRNRVHNGTAAFEILVPFRLTDGRVFLVDRGWEPPGNTSSVPDHVPAAPEGQVTVVARLQPGESLPSSGSAAPEGQVPSINLDLIASRMGSDGAALERGAYGTLVSESPAPATTPQAMESPDDDPGPYLSYAVQWVMFAVMGFIFIWYVIRSERRARREAAEDAAAAAELARTDPEAAAALEAETAARRARKGLFPKRTDRDMEDEDAILDRAGR
jgi:cytochrome oxidase assembly protein ShyY1